MSDDKNKDMLALAEKIGQALAETKEFLQKQEAEQQLRSNREARKLVKDFQTLKNSFERMEKLGHMLTEKNKVQLKEVEDKAMANPIVKNWFDRSQQFYDLVIAVNKKMQAGITE
ncbi:YlbF family regulator [Peptococcaceae bacterium 1198_IL3148]